ncbi:MAG: hypothetical protein B0A82_19245 [Alkalinema sp. CACIAM 70d]|nr:MAG: hypothetical protein B0A82_19245 [Alkalinema sp. CACIAM 70d]
MTPPSPQILESPQAPPCRILLAHGSRRPGGNTIVEQLARDLDAHLAYWSMAPSLEDCLNHCMNHRLSPVKPNCLREGLHWETIEAMQPPLSVQPRAPVRRIVILPYFLSEGGITDAIAQQVRSWSNLPNKPQVDLLSTLDANPALVELILKRLNDE